MGHLTLIAPTTKEALFNEYGAFSRAKIKRALESNNVPNNPVAISSELKLSSINSITINSLSNNSLSLMLPKDGEFTVSIFSVNGKSLYSRTVNGTTGINNISLSGANLAQQVVMVRVKIENITASKSVLIK
jgi:hypothetical protein